MTEGPGLISKERALPDKACLQLFRDVACPGALCVARAKDPLPKWLPVEPAVDRMRAIRGIQPCKREADKEAYGAPMGAGVAQSCATSRDTHSFWLGEIDRTILYCTVNARLELCRESLRGPTALAHACAKCARKTKGRGFRPAVSDNRRGADKKQVITH